MSNPTPVIDFTDDLAAFLARQNQFGEANQLLVQSKRNKSPGDGATSPGFPASESTAKSVAQWPNMVDDFVMKFFGWTGGTDTLGKSATLQRFTLGIQMGTVSARAGAGDPNGVVTAPVGSLFLRTDGAAGTTLYIKELGSGNTGWSSTSASAESLATTLGVANTTGGTNIVVTSGDSIESSAGALALDTGALGVTMGGNVDITTGTLDVGGLATFDGTADANVVTVAGAVVADAPSFANDLVIGNGVGTKGLTIFSGTTSGGVLVFTDTTGLTFGLLEYDHNQTRFEFSVESVTSAIMSGTEFSPAVSSGLTLGSPSLPWASISAVDGTFTGDVALNSSGTRLDIGDGTGSMDMALNKGAGSSARFAWRADAGSGINNLWLMDFQSAEQWEFKRRNATGGAVDIPIAISWVTGFLTLANKTDGLLPFALHSASSPVSSGLRFLPFAGTVADATITAIGQAAIMAHDGEVTTMTVTSDTALGSTTMRFYRNGNTTAVESQTETMSSANAAVKFTFTSSTFSAGNRIHISIDPTNFATATHVTVDGHTDTTTSV